VAFDARDIAFALESLTGVTAVLLERVLRHARNPTS
jgi:hypothetical protein